MRILGAVLGGGQSSRFGSDKALASHRDRPLIDHALDALRPHVDGLVVVGRDWKDVARVVDLPEPGLGPLGGLLGVLSHAEAHGFDAVLSCGCDTLGLTAEHIAALRPAPAVLDALPIVGLWPVGARAILADWLSGNNRRSVYAFADHIGARRIIVEAPPANINRPEDLRDL